MDWRSAGYWPVYKDGKKVWIPKDNVQKTKSQHDQLTVKNCSFDLYPNNMVNL
jgi:hypothetical protein